MRRTLLVLTLLVGVIFTFGAGAAPALAANCSVHVEKPAIYPSGGSSWPLVAARAGFYGCTDVSAVRIKWAPGTTPGTGFKDGASGGYATAATNSSPYDATVTELQADFTYNIPSETSEPCHAQDCDRYLINCAWWFGAPNRPLYAFMTWQIKGRASGVWGPLHAAFGAWSDPLIVTIPPSLCHSGY